MKQVLLLCAVMALALASPMQGMDILYFYSTIIYVALFDDFFVSIYLICGQLNNGCGVIEYYKFQIYKELNNAIFTCTYIL